MSRKVNFHAKFGFRFSFHNGFSRKRIFSTKFIDKVRFGFQFSRKIFSNNLFRKSRREAFSVSSENMLPTTFCSYKKLRTSFTNNYKYKQNIDSTITFSDKKPYLAISCNCCCRQYFLWRILFNSNDLGSFFRQFGSFLKMYDIYLKMYDIILLMYDINLKMYDIFLLMYAIYLKMYSIILLMYRSFLN